MRFLLVGLTLLALGACGESATRAEGCAREATHEVLFSDPEAPDIVTASADGPTCAQAVVLLTIRDARGEPLWAFASTYYDMTQGGPPPEGAPPVSPEDMDRFLAGWADLTVQNSGALPEWRADAESLSASVQELSYDTPFGREAYEALRASDLTQVCYAAGVEASQCLVIDPPSRDAVAIVTFGP